MTKLHELLAVERGAQATAKKLMGESLRTLNKDSLFRGMTRSLAHFSDNDSHLDLQESQNLETTVGENLDYLANPWAKWIDIVLRKDTANMSAKADIELDGGVFASNVPATTLLGLETKLTELRAVFEAIPTLPPGVAWVVDEHERAGVYRSESPVVTHKEIKDNEFKVVAEATEDHPAQVAQVQVNRAVGKYEQRTQSGCMTSLQKAQHLTRLDTLLGAIKQARARANEVEVVDAKLGNALFDFIRGQR